MSATWAGVGAGALWAAIAALSAGLSARRRSEAATFKRVDRFARDQDLRLPPELVAAVDVRLRRRSVVGLLLSGLLGGPFFGLATALMVTDLTGPGTRPGEVAPFQGPAMGLLVAAPLGLVVALTHLWDVARVGQDADGARVARVSPVVLRDAVPPWLTWAGRVAAVLPPLLVVALAAGDGHLDRVLGFLVAAVLAAAGVWAVERLQLGILNGPQSAGSRQELAFDDAFRVSTVLPLVTLVPTVGVLACALCFQSLRGQGAWVSGIYFAWQLAAVAVFFLTSAVNWSGVRRYYRRSVPKPPVPESATC